jgi:hypothetical protein
MSLLSSLPLIKSFFPAPNQLSPKETSDRILEIVDKLKCNIELSQDDHSFLDFSSKLTSGIGRYVYSFVSTPADEPTAQTIDTLSRKILSNEISAQDALNEASTVISSLPSMTTRESAAVAGLVNSYLSHLQSFNDILSNFQTMHSGNQPTRDELIALVDQFNYATLPNPTLAGKGVASVAISVESDERARNLEVLYNEKGQLAIKDGPVAPMDISCSQVLSKEKITKMKDLYNQLAGGSNYNNLALVLEFAKTVAMARTDNSNLSLSEIFTAFDPNLVSMHEKYQSGTCGVLAKRFCHDLKSKLNVDGQSIGSQIQSNWMSLPIPGTEERSIKWTGLSEEVRGADHTDAVVAYRDENGNHQVIKFACSMGDDISTDIEEYRSNSHESGVERYFNTRRYAALDHLPDQTIEEGTIAKTFLKGRFKAVMSKQNRILGIDFLRGNFYMNPSWAKSDANIPLNKDKMASINLADLSTPDAIGTYFVRGEKIEMSHRQALHMMIEAAQPTFTIPADFEENILSLAQIAPEFSEQLYLQPLPLIKQHYDELQLIAKKMKALSSNEMQIETYKAAQVQHEIVLKHLIDNKPEELTEAIAKLMQLLDSNIQSNER